MNLTLDIPDFHAHILPGADHGSSSTKTSLMQLKLAANAGIKRIIATPHFYPNSHTVKDFLAVREASYLRLKSRADADMPQIRVAAEVLLCKNIIKLEGLSELCIYGTNTILIELPYHSLDDDYVKSVKDLVDNGYDVILAHVDKYEKDDIERFIPLGVRFQINAYSLARLFPKKHLLDWIASGRVVALGSDIHGEDKAAYRKFNKAQLRFDNMIKHLSDASNEIWQRTKEF